MHTLMVMMVVIIILLIPTIHIFSKEGHYRHNKNYFETQFMMGNLGQRVPRCLHYYVGYSQPMKFDCETGKIANLTAFGLMPTETKEFKNDFCGLPSDHLSIDRCNNFFLNSSLLLENHMTKCFNKESCEVDPT